MVYEYGEPWCNDIHRVKTKTLGKPVPMLLCTPQIPEIQINPTNEN
jgi:hypothetical protein